MVPCPISFASSTRLQLTRNLQVVENIAHLAHQRIDLFKLPFYCLLFFANLGEEWRGWEKLLFFIYFMKKKLPNEIAALTTTTTIVIFIGRKMAKHLIERTCMMFIPCQAQKTEPLEKKPCMTYSSERIQGRAPSAQYEMSCSVGNKMSSSGHCNSISKQKILDISEFPDVTEENISMFFFWFVGSMTRTVLY